MEDDVKMTQDREKALRQWIEGSIQDADNYEPPGLFRTIWNTIVKWIRSL